MPITIPRRSAAVLTLLFGASLATIEARPPGPHGSIERRQAASAPIVAIGDIHGAADEFVGILQAAGLTDAQGRWTGGTRTFVQTGDYLDRGGGARRVLDLLMALETQARDAGGRAEILLGNHEVMNMLDELSDVSAQTYASFADAKSDDRRQKAFRDRLSAMKRSGITPDEYATEAAWMAAHPPGFVEYVDAVGPKGRYGKWLRARKAVALVDGTLFMHAGIAPGSTGGVDDINGEIARAIKAWDDATDAMGRERLITPYFSIKEVVAAAAADLGKISAAVNAGQPVETRVTQEYVAQLKGIVEVGKGPLLAAAGPMWFRGLSQTPSEETDAEVTALLTRVGATRMVVGHTPQLPGHIVPRFGNRVFAIDTGMLSSFFKGGRASALELSGGRVTAIYRDGKQELTVAGAGY